MKVWCRSFGTLEQRSFNIKILPRNEKVFFKRFYADYLCTARNLSYADLEFMMQEGILADKVISRPKGNNENDAKLKRKQLNSFLSLKQFKNAKIYVTLNILIFFVDVKFCK